MLTDTEKALVRELSMNPAFASICRKARTHQKLPRWRRGSKEPDQESNWKYRSGFLDGVDFVLNLLGYNDER